MKPRRPLPFVFAVLPRDLWRAPDLARRVAFTVADARGSRLTMLDRVGQKRRRRLELETVLSNAFAFVATDITGRVVSPSKRTA